MKETENIKNANAFYYVGERTFWKYRSSWGLILPSLDCERLKIDKNTVARLYISYTNRIIVIKVVDVREKIVYLPQKFGVSDLIANI